jgi:hypothetical protein
MLAFHTWRIANAYRTPKVTSTVEVTKMEIKLSRAMLSSIDEHLYKIRTNKSVVDVYRTAETIRLAHIEENVALEDIIEKLVLRAGSFIALEFSTTGEKILHFNDGSEPERLPMVTH